MGYPGIYTIRGVMGVCHLLVDAQRQAVLLDTGLVGEPWLIRWRVARLGLKATDIKAILLTHGHLDHAGNLAWAKQWTGAPVYAHPLEQPHIDGTYPYAGVNAWCGRLERAGRALMRRRPLCADRRSDRRRRRTAVLGRTARRASARPYARPLRLLFAAPRSPVQRGPVRELFLQRASAAARS